MSRLNSEAKLKTAILIVVILIAGYRIYGDGVVKKALEVSFTGVVLNRLGKILG